MVTRGSSVLRMAKVEEKSDFLYEPYRVSPTQPSQDISSMVTHNLRHAVEHGTRTVMMHNGEAIMDVSGAEKDNKTINDYLTVFNEISIECGN